MIQKWGIIQILIFQSQYFLPPSYISDVFELFVLIAENPLSCSCDSQELWEWLRDHQKLVKRTSSLELRCEHPPELRGRIFLELDPEQFCDQPLVVKLGIQDIQPFSVLVSWQSRNHSGLHGYQVLYYSLDTIDEVSSETNQIFCYFTWLNHFFFWSSFVHLEKLPKKVFTEIQLTSEKSNFKV